MKPISPEQLRILVAASESRLGVNEHFRYVIEGENPPERREREKLQKRGLLTRMRPGERMLTDRGIEALFYAPLTTEVPNQEQLMAIRRNVLQQEPIAP